MDENLGPATGNPAPGTDQAPEVSSNQAPTAVADQGESARVDDVTNASQVPSSSQIPGSVQSESVPAEPQSEAALESAAEAPEATSSEAAPEAPAASASRSEAAPSQPSGQEMTMEDVLAASDEQLQRKPVHRGMIATGEIIMLAQDGIVVDVGAKIEGILPYNQLFEHESNQEEAAKYFKPGDQIQVYVIRSDIPNSVITLSKKRADQERVWNLLQEIHEKQKPVEVEVVEKVRGGLVANLGVRAFLPASQIDVRRVNDLSPFVGKRIKVRIIELNRRRNRVIVSRRSILEEEIAHLKEETLKRLEPGAKLEGEVVEITDFGVFVNLGGIDGLVHRSELTHGRFNHPREVVELGDKVKVEILDMDLERERINLSMKKLAANPWENVLANYTIGQRIEGTVTNITPFGAFVEIEPGLEGLIHVSEMSWTKRIRHPKEVVEEGDKVEAMILKVDTQQQRISLGLRQTQPDPWSSLPDRYPPGTEVTGPITGITDFGVFMEIEEGIEGLVHISELSHDHVENIAEHFNRGDEVTAVILNIDPVEQRASLSRKRMLPFTPENAAEFGGNAPAGGAPRGEYRGGGAGAQPGGAGRQGRRGRRSQGIDYDYSYVADANTPKTTTKLGDVYADLFAQFGLGEAKTETESASAKDEAPVDAAAAAGVESAVQPAVAVEAPAPKPKPAPVVKAEAEEPVDPENAIDAAEAAALLTAAFRQGRRGAPVAADDAAAAEEAELGAAAEAADSLSDAEADDIAEQDGHDEFDEHA